MDESRSLPTTARPPNSGPIPSELHRSSRAAQARRPNTSLSDDYQAVVIGLIADARRLAVSRIGLDRPLHADAEIVCRCCRRVQREDSLGNHTSLCLVGAVLARLAQLDKLQSSPGTTAGGADDRAAGRPQADCAYCGPVCYGGAEHNARVEDGAFYGSLPGEPAPARDQADGFGEPWQPSSEYAGVLVNSEQIEVYVPSMTDLFERDEKRYARHVAACVNFCAGVATGDLEGHRLIDYKPAGPARGLQLVDRLFAANAVPPAVAIAAHLAEAAGEGGAL